MGDEFSEGSWSPSTQTLEGHSDWVQSVTFSPDRQTLPSASWDNIVKLWDTKTGAQLQIFKGHSSSVLSVVFSPDGHTLAGTGWADNTIRLWDTKVGTQLQILEGNPASVFSVAFSPDGQTLASGSSDSTIRLWDTKTGAQLQMLEGNLSAVQSAAFSSDGRILHSDCDPSSNKSKSAVLLLLSDNLIALGGRNLLWLPPEHRSFSCFSFKDATLALGYDDGRLSIIGFRTP
ncbi:WD40-repeat-containing domain protein [Aspergillus falconensis]